MRIIAALICAIVFVMDSSASDVRIINRIKIDLQPIHDWKSAKTEAANNNTTNTTERPLKHWKEITVTELVTSMVSPVVVITSEDGITQSAMLRNCPARLVEKLNRKNGLLAQLGRASAASKYAAAVAEEKRGRTSSSYSVSGNAAYVNAVVQEEQRKQDEAAAATAKEKLTKANQEAIEGDLEKVNAEIKAEGKLLAMAIGGTYAGFQTWDTGMTTR